MAMINRIEALKALLTQNPGDPFLRYGLAMEYVKAELHEKAAAEFQAILDTKPDYVPAYFHYAQTLEKLDRLEDAR